MLISRPPTNPSLLSATIVSFSTKRQEDRREKKLFRDVKNLDTSQFQARVDVNIACKK